MENIDEPLAELATQLKRIRAVMGITQVEVAERAGLSQQCVAKAENGYCVTLRSLIKIGNALDTDCRLVRRRNR